MHYIKPHDRNQRLFFSSLDDFVSSEHPPAGGYRRR